MTQDWGLDNLLLKHSEGLARADQVCFRQEIVFLELIQYCSIYREVLDEPAVIFNLSEKRLLTIFLMMSMATQAISPVWLCGCNALCCHFV